jgi:hypothetical protein
MPLQTAPASAAQLALFDRTKYLTFHPTTATAWPQSTSYHRWVYSTRHDRQKVEALIRQRFMCAGCGKPLDARRCDLHHSRGYADLGYEEASDLVAVHRTCHRRLEDAERRDRCGCRATVAA